MNPYYYPEKHDPKLRIVASFDAYEPNYDFYILLVVEDVDAGKFYVATDEGCSCPTPFEWHKWPDNWSEVKRWEDVKSLLDAVFPNDRFRPRLPHDRLRAVIRREIG